MFAHVAKGKDCLWSSLTYISAEIWLARFCCASCAANVLAELAGRTDTGSKRAGMMPTCCNGSL